MVVQGSEDRCALKDDIGCVLGLHDAPVIAAERLEGRAIPRHSRIHQRVKLGHHQAVREILRLLEVGDMGEGIVIQLERHSRPPELRGQPVVAVEVEKRPERTPGRNGQEAQTEYFVDEVEVVVEALATVPPKERVAGGLVVPRLVRRTRLHRREDMHQPRMISALGEDVSNAILFAEGLHLPDVFDGHAFFGCHLLRVSTNRVAERLDELRVIEQADAAAVEHCRHRLRVTDARDRSLDHHAVEAGEHASDVFPMAFDQVRHQPTISLIHALTDLPLWFEAMPG
jgi:hypothetical protein